MKKPLTRTKRKTTTTNRRVSSRKKQVVDYTEVDADEYFPSPVAKKTQKVVTTPSTAELEAKLAARRRHKTMTDEFYPSTKGTKKTCQKITFAPRGHNKMPLTTNDPNPQAWVQQQQPYMQPQQQQQPYMQPQQQQQRNATLSQQPLYAQ